MTLVRLADENLMKILEMGINQVRCLSEIETSPPQIKESHEKYLLKFYRIRTERPHLIGASVRL